MNSVHEAEEHTGTNFKYEAPVATQNYLKKNETYFILDVNRSAGLKEHPYHGEMTVIGSPHKCGISRDSIL